MPKKVTNRDIVKLIGRKVFTLRKQNKMTREELASKINISHQQLFKYEMGYNRITIDRLLNIATALNHNIQEFL